MTDNDGNIIDFQIIWVSRTSDKDKHVTLFMADVPAMGYTTCRLFLSDKKKTGNSASVICVDYSMDNGIVKVEFYRLTGEIKRFYEKKTGENIF